MQRQILSNRNAAVIAAVCLLAVGIAGTTIAGIQGSGRTMRAMGIVSIQGTSITVNGMDYSTDGATVTVDGSLSNLGGLHTGDVVTVDGSVGSDGTNTAHEITYVGDVRGVITAKNPLAGTVTVLNQVVKLNDATVIDGGLPLLGLTIGMPVEVSGFANSAGELVASRVEVQRHAFRGQVRGTIEALDANARTFYINSLLVDYHNANVGGVLQEGAPVVVQSRNEVAVGMLVAKTVDVLQVSGADGERGDLQGLITEFASAADFQLNGQRVIGDEHTLYVLNGAQLGPDVAVRVTGTFSAGALRADRVEVSRKVAAKAQGTASSAKGKAKKLR